jgi:hypothetical protein
MRARQWMQVAALASAVGLTGTAFANGINSDHARLDRGTSATADGSAYGSSSVNAGDTASAGSSASTGSSLNGSASDLNASSDSTLNGSTAIGGTLRDDAVTGEMSGSAARGSAEQTNGRGMPDATVQDFVNGPLTGSATSRSSATVDPTSSLDYPASAPNAVGTLNSDSAATTLAHPGNGSGG